jgi:hypothetical protein
VVCLALLTTGCTQKEFAPEKAQAIVGATPIHLDAEQVMLSTSQLECGVQNELWDAPGPLSQGRSVARLLDAGRALHFDDDVVVTENGYHQPYVQIRGDFPMQLADGPSIKDEDSDGKLVEGKLLVMIPHMCFTDGLPVMGVRKGQFSQDVNPVLEFRLLADGWHFTKLLH